MRKKGNIVKWFEDKGYGFVNADDSKEQIFAHISAFPKRQQRPVVGETVSFEVAIDAKKGLQAYNVLYANRPAINDTHKRHEHSHKPKKTKHSNSFITIVILVILGFLIYKLPLSNRIKSNITPNLQLDLLQTHTVKNSNFQCTGKTHCSEMTSCAEATFYLKNCPGTIADGDGDGIPCEDQWCGH